MLIKTIESKIKLATTVAIGSLVASVIIVIATLTYSFITSQAERKTIYVLSGEVPIEATRTDAAVNFEIEAKAHIDKFHNLFFTLPADEKYIENTISKAMYLADESAMRQYNTLQEKGFYSSILGSSANITIMTDSIILDLNKMSFLYYGVQRIERPASILKRQLITSGNIQQAPRTENNPHGMLITNWKTELNKDISLTPKRNL